MYKTKSELYELVSDLMSEDEFHREINRRCDELEGLLNEEAIAYLLVDEMGRNVVRSASISDLSNGDSVSLQALVDDVSEPRKFKRKNRGEGQVVNITIHDDTGSCRFTLWNKDVEAVIEGKIKIGSKIRIVNGYVKISDYGTEINVGKWGMFFIEE
ncbi:MAG: hypothetical protein JSV56_05090 [Methanomassiliicoccales archaeon]|nr:MAG: hypothetical protein JSV56_05090 [Methanomassiliicoccales archaeon]